MSRIALQLFVLVLCLSGCAQNKQPGYDMAYMECQAMASQITGPNGNMLTQSYYIANCLRGKGYQP